MEFSWEKGFSVSNMCGLSVIEFRSYFSCDNPIIQQCQILIFYVNF